MATNILFGDESEFLNDGVAVAIDVGILDEEKFIVVYKDNTNSGHGTAKIGSISGTNIFFGVEKEYLSTGGTDWNSVAIIDSSKFVVAYHDGPDSNTGKAKIGTVNGTTITFGPEAEFMGGGAVLDISVAVLSDTQFVVSYANNADATHGKVKIGEISGTTITFGPESKYLVGHASYMKVAALTASGFVVAYEDGRTNPKKGTTRIGSVSGTDVAFGVESEFNSNSDTPWISVETIDESKFVVVYTDDSDFSHGTAKIGTVSGTTITFGDETEYLSSDGADISSVAVVDSSQFIVVYRDLSDSNFGKVKRGTIDGTTIVFGDEAKFLSANYLGSNGVAVLDGSKFVIAYQDGSDSGHGTAVIGMILSPTSEVPLITVNHLTRTGDYDPQLIGDFNDGVSSVNISVWDIINGDNILVSIETSECYPIGNTNNWGWSTEHLPFMSGHRDYHYYFEMTADTNDTDQGEFFLR